MPTIVILPLGRSRGEQDYRQSDPGSDTDVDERMQREDRLSDEAARRHDKALDEPRGLQRISRRSLRR